jgi:hypothetical protein
MIFFRLTNLPRLTDPFDPSATHTIQLQYQIGEQSKHGVVQGISLVLELKKNRGPRKQYLIVLFEGLAVLDVLIALDMHIGGTITEDAINQCNAASAILNPRHGSVQATPRARIR